MAKNSTFNISLKLLTQQFTKGLNNVQKQLKSFGNFVKGTFAVASITMFARKVVETGAQFEDAMARVQAVSNATAGEMAMMTKEAEKLGSTTKYTAAEAAGALENLTRNGLSASDATKTLAGTLQLAQANAISLAEAANIITNTMNIFGLETKDTNRINDVLSATCANSATNITALAEAIQGVGPIAATMGKSIEETTAALGVLANRGVTGSEAGKALGAMFQRLAAQSPKAAAELKKYGLNIDETTLKTKSLDEILKILADSGIGKSQAALDKIFGKNYSAKIGVLINGVDEFNKQLEISQNAAGTTARMFEQGVGSTENAIKSLQSAYEGLMNSIFKRTSGVLNTVIKGLTSVVRALTDTKTRTVAIIGAISSALTIKLVKAMQKTRLEAAKTKVAMTSLQAGITTVTAAAKAAYAAMGGWVGILMTIGTMVATYFVNKFQKLNEITRELSETQATYTAEARNSINEIDRLLKLAQNENLTLETKKKLVEEINKKVKGVNAELTEEGRVIIKNKGKLEDYKKALMETAEVEAKRAMLNSLYNKKAMIEQAMLLDAQVNASSGQKAEASLQFIWNFIKRGYKFDEKYTDVLSDKYIGDLARELEIVNKNIEDIERNLKPEDWEKIWKSSHPDSSTGYTPPGGGHQDTPQETFDKAKEKYNEALKTAASRITSHSAKETDIIDEVISAQKSMIDAYVSLAAATGDNSVYESEEYKKLLTSYRELSNANAKLAEVRKQQKEDEEKAKNSLAEMQKARDRYNSKEGKADNTNPWDNFTSDPREYKKEQLNLKELEAELDRLQEAYNACKDRVKDVANVNSEEARDIMKWWNELGDLITKKTLEITEAQNELGKKEALDKIKDLEEEYSRNVYNSIRTTTSAIGTLTSALDSIANADWGSMSIAEKFSTITNAIFGTIDAVISAVDSFKTLSETFKALGLAKQSLNEIEAEGDKKRAEAAGAVAAAEMAKAQATVAATELEAGVIETALEIQRKKVSANSAEAISGAAASMANIPYVGAALAAAAAEAMAALLAGTLPKFASGGIIQGSSKYGDRLLARVNAGEMILNKQQQTRLFNLANGAGGIGGANVQFHIAGKDLVGVLRNNSSATNRISGSKGF